MEISRTEIMNGVALTYARTFKFKTAAMSISLLTQLQRETAAMNALIPYVLRRGTVEYKDMDALSDRLDELYGTVIEPSVRRFGEIQSIGFYASFPEDRFLPDWQSVLHDTAKLLGQLLLYPVTRGGLLLPDYVDSEREKMLDMIRSVVNNKRSYAVKRCMEEMCCFEDFATPALGTESECEAIRYRKLTQHYRELVRTCPIEIFYCGQADKDDVIKALQDALYSMPRGEINYDIGTDVRMNAVEDEPRYVEEAMDVSQGKLVMGFRLGDVMEEPDIAALNIFNYIFGGGSTSKLFNNVREKLQLCYYAGSSVNTHKGLMIVSSGIDFDKFEDAKNEILAQLDEMRSGNITDEEFFAAMEGVSSELRSYVDSQPAMESFMMSQTMRGLVYGPMELAEFAQDVVKEDIIRIAQSVELDMVYFLKGGGEADDDD